MQATALPMSCREMAAHGWDELDILFVSGDAYVDHPSFGTALLCRLLQAKGYRVGIVAQPRWQQREEALADISRLGRPRLFAAVTAGALDSMLAHYTAFRKKRSDDAYTPGGLAGARPNRAVTFYTSLVRQAFPALPVVIGGIEASLRRSCHYDFWDDALRRPILLDSKADLLIYGMAEKTLTEVANVAAGLVSDSSPAEQRAAIDRKMLVAACKHIPGIAYLAKASECTEIPDPITLPSYEELLHSPAKLMEATLLQEKQVHKGLQTAVQRVSDRVLVLNPPSVPLTQSEMDELYALPYTRLPHQSYTEAIPGWETVRASITTHRGCGGGCSFCSLALHQSRRISSRSEQSVLSEAALIAKGPQGQDKKPPRWAASLSDVSGPSANMWQAKCSSPKSSTCDRSSCLHPAICPFFAVDQKKAVFLLRKLQALPGISHVRVAGGVRFDLALTDSEALKAYTTEFTGGQLKVAPEHISEKVLRLMRKPGLDSFERFLKTFRSYCIAAGKEQYALPYLMSAFPGCELSHMRDLAVWLKNNKLQSKQVQCFIPTPGTVATAMYYAGISPEGDKLHVARTDKERLAQQHILVDVGNKSTPRKPTLKSWRGK